MSAPSRPPPQRRSPEAGALGIVAAESRDDVAEERPQGLGEPLIQPQSKPETTSHDERFQIRLVPYSPPRLSSDSASIAASSSLRRPSHTDSSPLPATQASPAPSDNFVIHHRETPDFDLSYEPGSVSRLSRSSKYGTPGHQGGLYAEPTTAPINIDRGHAGRRDSLYANVPSSPALSASPSPSPSSAPSRTPSPSSFRRPRKVINIHPGSKTFSLVPISASGSSGAESLRSFPPSLTTPSSSYGRGSFGTSCEDQPSSPATPLADSSSLGPPLSPVQSRDIEDSPSAPELPVVSSPWNYRLAGGLRKVAETPTPDDKQKQPVYSSDFAAEDSLPPLPDFSTAERPAERPLVNKSSFQSSDSESTLEERTNYKVYGQSSPVRPGTSVSDQPGIDLESLTASSTQSNYQVLAESSSSDQSVDGQSRPQTGVSDANYIVHGGPSASSTSLVSNTSPVRAQYSQESLVVPPLRPIKRRSADQLLSVAQSRSRESLRSASLTSISSVIHQEATRSLFSGASSIHIPQPRSRQNSWGASSTGTFGRPQMIPSHPHQWSTQLSTVASESEPSSEPPSRPLSPFSAQSRRGSGFLSNHSRQVLSVSSSLAGLDELAGQSSHSRHGSLEPPPPALTTCGSRTVRDYDEDGDGLADLGQLHHRSSRRRLASYLSNNLSDRNLSSSGSSRTNSLKVSTLPVWARIYYGSGERRFLITHPSSDSMFSLYNESRPGSAVQNRSPSLDRFGPIFNPRRRARDATPPAQEQPRPQKQRQQRAPSGRRPSRRSSLRRWRSQTGRGSMEIEPHPVLRVARTMKKQTSSLWSPHLEQDKRASRYSMWEPPSAVWSADAGVTGRRNMQPDMVERLQSTSHLDLHHESTRPTSRLTDSSQYDSARWWRNLNRVMAVVGVLLVAAAIALIVVGVQQQWS